MAPNQKVLENRLKPLKLTQNTNPTFFRHPVNIMEIEFFNDLVNINISRQVIFSEALIRSRSVVTAGLLTS